MTPVFLHHSALDESIESLGLAADHAQQRLRELRDLAIAEGAHVMLLVWGSLEWVLLAVETPPDVVVKDAAQLIPNLLANPDALAQMQRNSRNGLHLTWLQLQRPAAPTH